MNFPIQTQRLLITEFHQGMAESVHLLSIDDDNRHFVPDEVFETVDAARETIITLMGYYQRSDAPLVYPVCLHDGRQIGHVQAAPFEKGWEVGYHIGKAYTGNGYATEAVGAFLVPVMERLCISRIFGVCRADNRASRSVMKKCGFTLDHLKTGDYHGEVHDICCYSYTVV